MITKIEKMDHKGRGITYDNNKITFVNNALPEEEITYKVTKSRSKFNEAEVLEIVKPSKDRITPACSLFKICGGCDLLNYKYCKQLEFKTNKIKEIMTKYGDIDSSIIDDAVESPEKLNYRNKITLKYKNGLGYYEKNSNNIVKINECKLVKNTINNVIKDLNKMEFNNNLEEIIIREVNTGSMEISLFISARQKYSFLDKYCDEKEIKLNYFIKNRLIYSNNKSNIIGNLDQYCFKISPLAFFQVNTKQTINLYKKVIQYLNPNGTETLLDLYCGSGTIGLYCSTYFNKIIGIEINESSIQDANFNANINNINNTKFICGDVKDHLHLIKSKIDSIVVDPPRAGLNESVIKSLLKINSKKIVYVSCDPVTLARDIKLLSSTYKVIKMTPFDMFPQTAHCEVVCLLEQI